MPAWDLLRFRHALLPAGQATLYVDPDDGESILDGLKQMEGDAALRERCRGLGLERAQAFSRERTAREVLSVLREVAGEKGREP